MNNVTLLGRLTKDVDLRHTNSGLAVGRFTLAVDRNLTKEKKEEAEAKGQPTADFIRCIAFGKTAEMAERHLAKGLRVGVLGRIQTGSYDNEQGQRVFTTDVVVDRLNMIDWASDKKDEPNSNDGYDDGDFIPFDGGSQIPF